MSKVTPERQQTEKRKEEHIHINLQQDVQFPHLTTGLERYAFVHQALPELNRTNIDTRVSFFGHQLSSPVLVSSMTGGTEMARNINLVLAEAAQQLNIAMGVGSQRAAIEDETLAETFAIRKVAPDILLFANLGAVQFNYGYGIDQCRRAVEMIGADALILHFNVLQEAVQPEGDNNFAGLVDKIAEVTAQLHVPVIAKEVGWGFSPEAAKRLAAAGVQAIDVAGSGGTSWSEVEYHRAPDAFHARVARSFADWGIPTAESIQYVKSATPDIPIIASGGLRDGIDVAKCIALGATLTGMAGPFLKAAVESVASVLRLVTEIQTQLEIAMMCTGAKDINALSVTPLIERR